MRRLGRDLRGSIWRNLFRELLRWPESVAARIRTRIHGRVLIRRRSMDNDLANAISALVRAPLMPLNGRLECHATDFELPLDVLPGRDEFEKRAADPDKTHYPAIYHAKKTTRSSGSRRKTADYYLLHGAGDEFRKRTVDDILPGEVVVDYSLRQKKEVPEEAAMGQWIFEFCAAPRSVETDLDRRGLRRRWSNDLLRFADDGGSRRNDFWFTKKIVPRAYYSTALKY